MTFATRKVNKMRPPGRTIKYRSYATADMKALKDDLIKTDFDYLRNNQVQSNTTEFTTRILNVLNFHMPLKQRNIKPSNPSWFTADLVKTCNERDKLKLTASRTKSLQVWLKYKRLRSKVTSKIRFAKKLYFNFKFSKDCKSQSIWKNVNNLTNYKVKPSLSVSSITDPQSGVIT